ncbi:MAG: serine/threonine protein kinase, partial [Proteobacteria bacterium]|nr:serine/threonine protein kinase [Pseudomonadota bacterium]
QSYLVVELVEGNTLRDQIRAHGAMPWREAFRLGALIADALIHIHDGQIIHRDLKSANILLTGNERKIPKVTDFGLAHWSGATVMTQTGKLLGTIPYMPPEQVGGGRASPAWDLYSLGVIIYEMLTGKLPFQADDTLKLLSLIVSRPAPRPSSEIQGLPPIVDEIMSRMIAKSWNHRFPNGEALRNALFAALKEND